MPRASGILLHITSLPSSFGIGDLGEAAYAFADFLSAAGQRYWQILPAGPTGCGDSPYQTLSAFAGNPLWIDLTALGRAGLLEPAALRRQDWSSDAAQVDFARQSVEKTALLRLAYSRFSRDPSPEFALFCRREAAWLEDYSLFRALKTHFGERSWQDWEEGAKDRRPAALAKWRERLQEEIGFHRFTQFCFFRQWERLKAYANGVGVKIIGDIPIYMPLDSVDVWAQPENFRLTRTRRPVLVSGCPPDAFSADGQYWGHPVYDWQRMARDGYDWWLRRIGMAARFHDAVRIDHFRGLERYWAIPARNRTARAGVWLPGPGRSLTDAVRARFPNTEFIAEDLGFVTKDVKKLVRQSGFAGMKVLEFAFTPGARSEYLPRRCKGGCVVYTGTHDNPPLAQWISEADGDTLRYARRYLGLKQTDDLRLGILQAGMDTGAALFIAQMQDYLALGGEARMNVPGRMLAANWRWRMTPGAADGRLAAQIRQMTAQAGRLPLEGEKRE